MQNSPDGLQGHHSVAVEDTVFYIFLNFLTDCVVCFLFNIYSCIILILQRYLKNTNVFKVPAVPKKPATKEVLPAISKKEITPPAKGILPLHCPHES